jgi:glycosyltransferase involved in cell wall biosynthesis
MPKIGVIHIITKLELGGAQQNTLYTVSHLDPEKFETYLITGPGGLLDGEASRLGGHLVFIPELKREIHPIFDLVSLIKIRSIIRKIAKSHPGSPLLVHTHSSKAGILGRLAAYLADRSVIIVHTFHGFGFHDFQNGMTRRLYILLERAVARITRRMIFVSRDNAERAGRLGITRGPSHLIRSGISFQAYRKPKTKGPGIRAELGLAAGLSLVTTVACLKAQKSPLDFIRAAHWVLNVYPDVHFLLVGDGPLREAAEAEVQRLQIGNSLSLLGWRRDVPEILRTSTIFVLASLWEGLPRVLIEARLSSLPIVTTDIEGAGEMIEEGRTGFIVPKKDYLALGKKVLYLLENPEVADRMGAAGRNVPAEYDIDEMVKRQQDLYSELVQRG